MEGVGDDNGVDAIGEEEALLEDSTDNDDQSHFIRWDSSSIRVRFIIFAKFKSHHYVKLIILKSKFLTLSMIY